jgi:outer membrane biosynthesis protein TonB
MPHPGERQGASLAAVRQLTLDRLDPRSEGDPQVSRRARGHFARPAVASVVAGAVLIAFATVTGVGFARFASPGASQYQYQYGQPKVTLCHKTHSKKHPAVTITVGAPAVPAHLRHGDHLGPCTEAEMHPAQAATTTAKPNHKPNKQKPQKAKPAKQKPQKAKPAKQKPQHSKPAKQKPQKQKPQTPGKPDNPGNGHGNGGGNGNGNGNSGGNGHGK